MSDANGRISGIGTVGVFLKKGACSQTLFHVLNRAYGHPIAHEELASAPLSGGLMMNGYQCGQLWGAALASGAEACRRYGTGVQAEARAVGAARSATDAFRAQTGCTDCYDITELNEQSSKSIVRILIHMLPKGGPLLCLRMAARYAPAAFRAIDRALSDEAVDTPPAPVSCASLVAKRLGATDEQAVIAAGLAGGIGLSGGACGALGAAIWLTELNDIEGGAKKTSFKHPEAQALIDRFLPCTNYEFECAAIVGRRFDGVADHARHVCQGGCSKIVDALTAGPPAERAPGSGR